MGEERQTIVGDPEVFAIECDILPGESSIQGHFCLWLGGYQVANFVEECLVTMPIGQLATSLFAMGGRQNPDFASCGALDCLDLVWEKVYSRRESDWREGVAFHRFVWLEGPPFSEQFRSILLDTPQGVRVIWQETDEAPAREVYLPYEIYTSLIRGVLSRLYKLTGFVPVEPAWVTQQVNERFKEGRKAEATRNRKQKDERREQQRRISRQDSTLTRR